MDVLEAIRKHLDEHGLDIGARLEPAGAGVDVIVFETPDGDVYPLTVEVEDGLVPQIRVRDDDHLLRAYNPAEGIGKAVKFTADCLRGMAPIQAMGMRM